MWKLKRGLGFTAHIHLQIAEENALKSIAFIIVYNKWRFI